MIPLKKIGLGLLGLLLLIQFFQIDKTNPAVDREKDFIYLTQPSDEITAILMASCYDCHSHETSYPWYSYVSPFSWIIGHDIEEGREHLNFSLWGDYSDDKAEHKLEECYEEVEEGEMPLAGYVRIHPQAVLSDEQKKALLTWFDSLR